MADEPENLFLSKKQTKQKKKIIIKSHLSDYLSYAYLSCLSINLLHDKLSHNYTY